MTGRIGGRFEAVMHKYLELRLPANNGQGRSEYFIETLRRIGQDPFKLAANDVRQTDLSLAEAIE